MAANLLARDCHPSVPAVEDAFAVVVEPLDQGLVSVAYFVLAFEALDWGPGCDGLDVVKTEVWTRSQILQGRAGQAESSPREIERYSVNFE